MSNTLHRDTAEAELMRFIEDPAGISALEVFTRRLREDNWDPEYLAQVGQFDPRAKGWRSPAQVMGLMLVHHTLMQGYFAEVPVSTRGATPTGDAYREENAASLADLPRPFVAEVDMDQYGAPQDGVLRWTEPIQMEVSTRVAYMAPGAARHPSSSPGGYRRGKFPLR